MLRDGRLADDVVGAEVRARGDEGEVGGGSGGGGLGGGSGRGE